MSKITASIVLFNTPSDIVNRLVSCLIRSKYFDKIYVIDNSRNSHNYFSNNNLIRYIHNPSNNGYGFGHNIALNQILPSSKYHFVLNPDIYFEPSQISSMIKFIDQDEEIGLLMPKIIYPDGSLQYLCKLLPTPSDLLLRRFSFSFIRNIFQKSLYRYELRFTKYKNSMNVPSLSGCFMLLRVSALAKVGLFDERFFMYAEDLDLSRRIHETYKTVYYPGATVVHEYAKASYKSFHMMFIHISSIIKYFNKWGWFFDNRRKVTNSTILKSLYSGQ